MTYNAYFMPRDEGFIADPYLRKFYETKPARDADSAKTIEAIASDPCLYVEIVEAFDARWRQSILDMSPFAVYAMQAEWEAQRAIDVKAYQAEYRRAAFAKWISDQGLAAVDTERDEIMALIPPMQGESFPAWSERIVAEPAMAAYVAERNASIDALIAAGFDPQIFGVPMTER